MIGGAAVVENSEGNLSRIIVETVVDTKIVKEVAGGILDVMFIA